jgi:SAM-dependent methyltransferase
VGFWLDLAAQTGGPVLELACGTGRLTIPLAQAGVEIVGVDNDPDMLAVAGRRARSARRSPNLDERLDERLDGPLFVASDMRRFALARRFRLAFVGYNSIQLLTARDDMIACLASSRQHLAPDGRLALEVTDFQVDGADGPEADGGLVPLAEADGIRLSASLEHDLGARTSRYRRHFDGDGWTVANDVVMRSLDRPELEALLHAADLIALRWIEYGATLRVVAAPASPAPRRR